MSKTLIITPCSDRKRGPKSENLSASLLTSGSLKQVAREWWERVTISEKNNSANRVYKGRSFSTIMKSKNNLNCDLLIISAGLGLVEDSQNIPNYSLTVSRGSKDSIKDKLVTDEFVPSDWWTELKLINNSAFNLVAYLEKTRYSLIILNLSINYTRMIFHELKSLPKNISQKIRIVGVGVESYLPNNLRDNLLDYDQRLNGPQSELPGTMSDLGSRCIYDFSNFLLTNKDLGKSLEFDKAFVTSRLKPMEYPKAHDRTQLSNEEIIKFLLDNWKTFEGKSTKSLRFLRDEGFACEQGRFRDLFYQAKNLKYGQKELEL